jgi:hypothetical protein
MLFWATSKEMSLSKMWRMALLIRYNSGERKNNVGHRCSKACFFKTHSHRPSPPYMSSRQVLFEWPKALNNRPKMTYSRDFDMLPYSYKTFDHPLIQMAFYVRGFDNLGSRTQKAAI